MLPEQPPARITSISRQTWVEVRTRLGKWIWAVVAGVVAWEIGAIWLSVRYGFVNDDDSFLAIIALPFIGIVLYVAYIQEKVRAAFWRQFAATHGFTYMSTADPKRERADRFQHGHGRRINHVIAGQVDNRPLRLFTYRYTIGSGKHKTTYYYTVFEFKVAGQFPHLYLDSRKNFERPSWGGVVISLPTEFEKEFRLIAPKEYEIEALQIFTPDVLAYLLDSKLQYDIELVDQELLVFIRGQVKELDKLEADFTVAAGLMQRLAKALDTMRYAEIPRHPTSYLR